MSNVLDILGYREEDSEWLAPELYRRAALCFEQAAREQAQTEQERVGWWRDAAECWADAGEGQRSAAIYARYLDDHASAAPLLLAAGRYAEGQESYRVWLERVQPGDVVSEVRARLGIAACLIGEARAAEKRGDVVTRDRKQGQAQAIFRRARGLVRDEEGRDPLTAGRCWEALGAYGDVVGRNDLMQVGYDVALRRYGERYGGERVRAAREYLAAAKGNLMLVCEIESWLVEWEPEGELREWERLRDEIERLGFRDGVRDVLHFVDEDVQLEAWYGLAGMEDDPEQVAIDEYLRGLAPEGMVYVPAGAFLMGSTEDDPDARDDEKPQHEVRLGGYYIGRYPVTNEKYRVFIEDGGYQKRVYWTEEGWARKERDGWTESRLWNDVRYNGPRRPVVGVSWYEAVAYCNWRGLRLPSEAEWEKAAGWDPVEKRKQRYPWGDEWDENKRDRRQNSNWQDVGSVSPDGDSAYGVADMAGLYTWCSTRWGMNSDRSDYGYPSNMKDDRDDLSGSDNMMRIMRGCGYGTQQRAGCAFRVRRNPGFRNSDVGFRYAAPRHLLSE